MSECFYVFLCILTIIPDDNLLRSKHFGVFYVFLSILTIIPDDNLLRSKHVGLFLCIFMFSLTSKWAF